MKTLKKLADVGVFSLALISSIAFTRFLMRPHAPAQPPPVVEIVAETPAAPETPVSFSVRLVTLDLGRRQSHTTLVLERDPRYPAPESVWVWTHLFTPSSQGGTADPPFRSFSEPVEIRRPFAAGDRVTLVADSECSRCDGEQARAGGFYAHVNVSTQSSAAAYLSGRQLSYEIETATPVVIEAARKNSR